MSRRPNAPRRIGDGGSIPFVGALHSKAQTSPLLSVGIFAWEHCWLLVIYITVQVVFRVLLELQYLIPTLKKTYGDSMKKVLHLGPETCSVVSTLLKEEDTEGWGIEPYKFDDVDASCKNLVRKGLVRAVDIRFPLPYRPKSFSLVIVSDALDYMSPKYLNRTFPHLARLAFDGLVILSGYQVSKEQNRRSFPSGGRPAKLPSSAWWIRYFIETSLEENESAVKKFEQAVSKKPYKSACQVFHLKPLH